MLLELAGIWALAASEPVAPPTGRSVEGRALRTQRIGDARAGRRILVVGAIHGDEPAGRAVTRALARAGAPSGAQVWIVHDLNPDGTRRGTRANARGVDLNRNFPHRWRGRARRDRYWPGPRAASEPETRWLMRAHRAIRPHVTVWLHQPYGFVVDTPGASDAVIRRYARRARLPVRALPRYRGTAAGWQNARGRSSSAFVVELGAERRPTRRAVARHVEAVHAVARTARSSQMSRPRIAWTPIPYGGGRRAQMRRYARRHYGIAEHHLRRPRVIVQHYTVTDTFRPVFDTFAANAPDPELNERPGVCAHFVIDRNGTIHQLVPLGLMCRHTIGLNHRAIGIEHVGRSDGQVMANCRQLRASLRLTRWLQHRHAIRTRDVIGHAESLRSPYHHERVARLRERTHGDFAPRTMGRYRSLLWARTAACAAATRATGTRNGEQDT